MLIVLCRDNTILHCSKALAWADSFFSKQHLFSWTVGLIILANKDKSEGGVFVLQISFILSTLVWSSLQVSSAARH